jgi:hypothetical protein
MRYFKMRSVGIDAIAERIGGFGARFPRAPVAITSGVDEHHGFARYAWTITGQTAGRFWTEPTSSSASKQASSVQ